MKRISTAFVIGLAVVAASAARAEDTNQAVKADMALLQGGWSMVSGTANGEITSAEVAGTMKRVCKGDEATVTRGGQLITRAKFTIDPSAKPKTIDYQTIEGPTKGRTLLGIYELHGDTVKFCFGPPGGDRPAEFVSSPGDRRTLTVWKRVNEAAPDRTDNTSQAKMEMAKLEGEWSMVSGSADGYALPEAMLTTARRVCKGDETTTTMGGQLFMKARFTIDPSRKPKTIDYQMIEGFTKGKEQLGIYELDGDTFKSCFAAPGAGRPSDFTTNPGDGRTVSTWKRLKEAPAQPAGK